MAQSCVFGKQLPGPFLCASPGGEDPFSRSYGADLPSSLTTNHPSALVYSTRPRVSVYGTDAHKVLFSGFSRRQAYPRCLRGPEALQYCQVRLGVCTLLHSSAPTPFNPLFRQGAEVSQPRHRITPVSSNGILNVSAIGLAFRLILRVRLTPGRLTSPGKPWSYGEGESHPLYRYLYLHLLFLTLHRPSQNGFKADRNAPLPILCIPRLRRTASYPIIIHAPSLD